MFSANSPQILIGVSLLLAIIIVDYVAEANPSGRIVQLAQGRIKGRYSETRRGRLFTEYFGIPYAKPPKRFKVSSILS